LTRRARQTVFVEIFLAGVALGFASGVSPGPLLALVITTTLSRGLLKGISVAIAPLLTDLPIIVIMLTVVSQVSTSVVAALSICGAFVVAWFGFKSLKSARTTNLSELENSPTDAHPWRQGALVNVLNPAPWLFWSTVGAPLLVVTWRESPSGAVLFLIGFYLLLVGMKVALAVALASARHRINDRGYRAILTGAGAMLIVFAVLLGYQGVQALLN
jgi:threonine/homoserine/homoserine lactone efflux protein